MANTNAAYAFNYLQSKYGYTPAQAAGIVGNLMQESSMNTGAKSIGDGNDGSNSIGLAQWNGSRANALRAFAANNGTDPGDINTQLDFIHNELQGSESGAGKRLANAQNVDQATQAFVGFERPQGWSANDPSNANGYANRLKYAYQTAGLDPSAIASATPTSSNLGGVLAQAGNGVPSDTSNVPVPTDRPDPSTSGGLLGLASNKSLPALLNFATQAFNQPQPTDDTPIAPKAPAQQVQWQSLAQGMAKQSPKPWQQILGFYNQGNV